MRTREKLELKFARLIEELDALARGAEFDAEDPLRFVRDAAVIWERTLKRCTLAGRASGDPTLNTLIDALASNGVDELTRDALHDLRRAANAGKHDPGHLIGSAEARRLIQSSIAALAQLEAGGVPELAAPATFGERRRYAITFEDHYQSGETAYEVYLVGHTPSAGQFRIPSPIELFCVNFDRGSERLIKGRLAATGEGSFTDAGWEWEGTHRDLVGAFAPHQYDLEGLIAGLSRSDHAPSVISAAALAIVDIARPALWQDVLWKMSTDFGIWRRGTFAEQIARASVEFLGGTVNRELYGPRWMARDDALKLLATAPRFEREGFLLGVDEQGVVIVGLDLRLHGISLSLVTDDDLQRPPDPLGP